MLWTRLIRMVNKNVTISVSFISLRKDKKCLKDLRGYQGIKYFLAGLDFLYCNGK